MLPKEHSDMVKPSAMLEKGPAFTVLLGFSRETEQVEYILYLIINLILGVGSRNYGG